MAFYFFVVSFFVASCFDLCQPSPHTFSRYVREEASRFSHLSYVILYFRTVTGYTSTEPSPVPDAPPPPPTMCTR